LDLCSLRTGRRAPLGFMFIDRPLADRLNETRPINGVKVLFGPDNSF